MNIRLLLFTKVCAKCPLPNNAFALCRTRDLPTTTTKKQGYQNSASEKVQLPEEFIIYRSIDEKQYTKGLSMTSLSLFS